MATLGIKRIEREPYKLGQDTPNLLKCVARHDPARQKRIDALMLMFGLWKGRTDIPNDGLAFQEELRHQD